LRDYDSKSIGCKRNLPSTRSNLRSTGNIFLTGHCGTSILAFQPFTAAKELTAAETTFETLALLDLIYKKQS